MQRVLSQGLRAPTRTYSTATRSTNRERELRRGGSRWRRTSLLRLLHAAADRLLLGTVGDGEEKTEKRKEQVGSFLGQHLLQPVAAVGGRRRHLATGGWQAATAAAQPDIEKGEETNEG